MPNINQKIRPFKRFKHLNELVDCVNWLLGMRTINGAKIGESTTGPVIDLGAAAPGQSSQTAPWAVDPNGSSTGWTLVTYLDANGYLWDMYVWSGIAFNQRPCS